MNGFLLDTEDIESIVTKEYFSLIEYKVEKLDNLSKEYYHLAYKKDIQG